MNNNMNKNPDTNVNTNTNSNSDATMNATIYKQIYAVTNRHLCADSADSLENEFHPLLQQIERLCQLGISRILLREKDLSPAAYGALAKQVLSICDAYEVPCTLHYFLEVAETLNHKKIHLPLPILREKADALDDYEVIGCSIHSVAEAKEAEKLHATYLTAGHIFQTDCKKDLPPRGLDFLSEVCESVSIPVYAIGGIPLDSEVIQQVKKQGAAGVCVMSQIMRC